MDLIINNKIILSFLISFSIFAQTDGLIIRTLFVNKDEVPYKVRLKCFHNSNSLRCSEESFSVQAKKVCDEFEMDFSVSEVYACVEPFEEEKNKKGELIENRCKLADYLCIPKKPKEEKEEKKK
jgi:hypothetical protein